MPNRGRLTYQKIITRDDVRANRSTLFVFGDNMVRKGMGGQAGAMRGEPNAVGIPTKWKPERTKDAYFVNGDWRNGDVRHAILSAFDLIEGHLAAGLDVVVPEDGIGTGLAELPKRAPTIFSYINQRLRSLEHCARAPVEKET